MADGLHLKMEMNVRCKPSYVPGVVESTPRGCEPGLTPLLFQKTIAQVLVHLHRNDYVAAERCVRESYR